MSRRPGIVQRRLIAALEPGRHFTVEQRTELVYPGEEIERWHLVSVRRALKTLKNLPSLDLHPCRAGTFGARGWRYVVGRAG